MGEVFERNNENTLVPLCNFPKPHELGQFSEINQRDECLLCEEEFTI